MEFTTKVGQADLRASAQSAHNNARNSNDPAIWSEAAKLWRLLAEGDNALKWDRFYYAEAIVRSGNTEAALPLAESLMSEPDMIHPAAMLKGEAYERLGRYAEAELAWRHALAAPGSSYWASFGLARALHALGQSREARTIMAEAIQSNEVEAGGLRFAASLDLAACDHQTAEGKFEQLGLSPDQRIEAVISSLSGMTTIDERMTLYRLARDAKGIGHFVDLGCFLGSLTIPMALGLKSNFSALAAGFRVHAFDLFQWEPNYMDNYYTDLDGRRKPKNGDDFQATYLNRIRNVSDVVVVHAGDLSRQRWVYGPIEILSIDAMKSLELGRHVCREFYPHLLANMSYIFHQDFCHWYPWWVHIIQYLARDFFEVVDQLPGSYGILFRSTKPLTEADAAQIASWDLRDANIAESAFEYAFSIIADRDAHAIAAAHTGWYVDARDFVTAERLLNYYLPRYRISNEIAAIQNKYLTLRRSLAS